MPRQSPENAASPRPEALGTASAPAARQWPRADKFGLVSAVGAVLAVVVALLIFLWSRTEPIVRAEDPLDVSMTAVFSVKADYQTVIGCLNGDAWALPAADRDQVQPEEVGGQAYVAPVELNYALLPDLPPEDYVVITGVEIDIIDFKATPTSADLVFGIIACLDVGFFADYHFDAVLDPLVPHLNLLNPANRNNVTGVALGTVEPTQFRIQFFARRCGWYTLRVRFIYNYHGTEFVDEPRIVRLYWPFLTEHRLFRGTGDVYTLAAESTTDAFFEEAGLPRLAAIDPNHRSGIDTGFADLYGAPFEPTPAEIAAAGCQP